MAAGERKIQPIIIKRVKKGGGHGHHGGAWKIAYADFVTAMMAFFLLMWLLGSTTKGDLQGIAEHFSTPLTVAFFGGSGSGDSSSVIRGGGEDLTRTILLQIILEEEAAGVPLLSEAALANLIRFYGHAMQPFMGRTLEQQLQAIADWQQQLGSASQSLQGPALQALMSNYLQQSQQALTQLQTQLQRQTGQVLGACFSVTLPSPSR